MVAMKFGFCFLRVFLVLLVSVFVVCGICFLLLLVCFRLVILLLLVVYVFGLVFWLCLWLVVAAGLHVGGYLVCGLF